MYSREQLANDFLRLGVVAPDTVMLHASVRAVGEIASGPRSDSPCPSRRVDGTRHSHHVWSATRMFRP